MLSLNVELNIVPFVRRYWKLTVNTISVPAVYQKLLPIKPLKYAQCENYDYQAPKSNQPQILILRLIGEEKVGCKRCKRQLNYENAANHVCLPASHLLRSSAETANLPLLLSRFPWLFSPHLQSLLFTKNRKRLYLFLCLTLCWIIKFYVVLWCNTKLEKLPKLEY